MGNGKGAPAGMTSMDEILSFQQQVKYARNGFDDAVEQLTRDVKGVQRYEADQAAQRQAREQKTSVPAPVSTDALKAAYETAKRLRRQADKITANELLTEQDSRTVDKLLRGDIDPEDVKGENRGGILRVYAAKKAVQDSLAPVKEYNAQRRAGLASEAAQDIAKSDAWKDKPGGLFYSTETMERNMRDIVPDRTEARALTEKYFTPVHANEAKATRWKNEQRARIAALNLTQAESEYLQVYGELQGAETAAAMGNKRSEAELELLSRTAEEMRKKYGSQLDMDKIDRGLELFRKEYDAIFEQMNEAYMRNGYAPVEYRSGYFPHFTDAYAGSGQRMKYEKAEEYGLGRIYAEMLRYADTNNSGTLNKDELRAYLDSTGLNRAQKAVLFELASTAKNPYE